MDRCVDDLSRDGRRDRGTHMSAGEERRGEQLSLLGHLAESGDDEQHEHADATAAVRTKPAGKDPSATTLTGQVGVTRSDLSHANILLSLGTVGFSSRVMPFLRAGLLSIADVQVVDLLAMDAGVTDLDTLLALAFAHAAPRQGHAGVVLEALATEHAPARSGLWSTPGQAPRDGLARESEANASNMGSWPDASTWSERVRACESLVLVTRGPLESSTPTYPAAYPAAYPATYPESADAAARARTMRGDDPQARDSSLSWRAESTGRFRPFVHDGELLMTDRFYRTQQRLLAALEVLASAPPPVAADHGTAGGTPVTASSSAQGGEPRTDAPQRPHPDTASAARSMATAPRWQALADLERARFDLDRLFPKRDHEESIGRPGTLDRQRLAALMILRRRLTIVSGGPGTGKTFTVRAALICFRSQWHAQRVRGAQHVRGTGMEAVLGEREPTVHVVAPTGKAAVRLAESLRAGTDGDALRDDERRFIHALVPSTVHRLLGVLPGTTPRYRQDASHPLLADLVVVDEASMVDLELMLALLSALPRHCHLVLVGDPNQLPSVAAGSVLADLRQGMTHGGILAQRRDDPVLCELIGAGASPTGGLLADELIEAPDAPVIAHTMVHLTRGRRTTSGGPLATLTAAMADFDGSAGACERIARCLGGARESADAVDSEGRLNAIRSPQAAEAITASDESITIHAHRKSPSGARISLEVLDAVLRHERANLALALELETASPEVIEQTGERLYAALSQLRVLTPHRSGALGVDGINAIVQEALADACDKVPRIVGGGFVPGGFAGPRVRSGARVRSDHRSGADAGLRSDLSFWPGRPVLVTANDHELGLMNGDIGLCIGQGASAEVLFPVAAAAGRRGMSIRRIRAGRLGAHETCFAMTVHKSQASELDTAVLVLPSNASRLMSREILYTGVTRARRRLVIAGTIDAFLIGMQTPVRRASALGRWIWGARAAPGPRDAEQERRNHLTAARDR